LSQELGGEAQSERLFDRPVVIARRGEGVGRIDLKKVSSILYYLHVGGFMLTAPGWGELMAAADRAPGRQQRSAS